MNPQKPPGSIEWTRCYDRPGYTSNPIRGCMHRCQWEMPDGKIATCYAKDIAEGPAMKRAYPNGFESLSFHPKELDEIKKCKVPSGIFLCSMADLFGAQVPDEWIASTLDCVRECPQHIFFSLTKNPPRLVNWKYPKNLWVGISAPPTFMFGNRLTEAQQRAWFSRGLQFLSECDAAIRWVSLEPLSFDLSPELEAHGSKLDWAVLGAASDGRVTHQPDKEDFRKALYALRGKMIFFKGNLSKALAGEVAGGWRAQFPPIPEPQFSLV